MIDLGELEKSISQLENMPLNFSVCEKLSWLYVVRDHANGSVGSGFLSCECDGDEFLEAANGRDITYVLGVLKEHMCALKCVYPKEYKMILEKLKNG